MHKTFDVIIFGATGFTGRLVAEYLNSTYGVGGEVTWAMAGRSPARLNEVRGLIGAPETLPLHVADATDAAALAQLVPRAKVIISTVGPYQLHGRTLVTACAQAGTDYVDLCGEPAWMAQMIPLLDAPARASGARIVFSCGFDSIPFDLGVVFLQDEAQRRFGMPLQRVGARVKTILGGMSGGTVASGLATLEQIGRDPTAARTMVNPFALTPGFRGPPQPDGNSALFDELTQRWTGPFMMAAINTKNVHRTNALRGHPWGREFVYDERVITGTGPAGAAAAQLLALGSRVQPALLGFAPLRDVAIRFFLPKPGQGPTRQQREAGRYVIDFVGLTADGRKLNARIRGDRDPGYGSTSKMISETALCLVKDVDRAMTGGGVWTPGAAMGLTLCRRLQERAGLTFAIQG